MDINFYFENVNSRLHQDNFIFSVDQIDDFYVNIAYKKEFKIEYLFTQMNIFIIMRYADYITDGVIKEYSQKSFDYAVRNNKGLPRGVQSGVFSLSLLASYQISSEAINWIQQRPEKHYAAQEIPIIYDLSQHRIFYYNGTVIWGAIYQNYLKGIIERNLHI